MAEPKVRFKKDDGSSYPAWNNKCFGDLFKKNNERNGDQFSEDRTISIASMSFNPNGNGADTDSLSVYKVLRVGDVAFEGHENKEFSHGRFVMNDIGDGIMSPRFSCMRPIVPMVSGFWKYYIHSEVVMRDILIRSTKKGTMMHELVFEDLFKQSIDVPCLEEQQKIADFLSSVDDVIVASQEEVANLETQKKAVMKKIFSQEVRFKKADGSDFPGWEEHPLSYYLEIRDEKQVPTAEAPLMAFIAYKGVADKGDRYDRSFLVKTDDKKYKRTEFNDFIYSSNNLDVGSIGLNKYGSAVISVVYEIFKVKDTAIPECINKIIQVPANMAKILQYRQGALYGQYKIHASDFLSVSVSTPCLEEQRLIADFLSDFDEAIAAAKKELELWKELKKGLLQQMFV